MKPSKCHPDKPNYGHGKCAACYKIEYLARPGVKERTVQFLKEYWARPETIRKMHNHHLTKKYGITIEQYEQMFQAQSGFCAICRKPSIKRLHVDHCHNTGKVRGLLCNQCNTALGRTGDSIIILQRMIKYLKKYE